MEQWEQIRLFWRAHNSICAIRGAMPEQKNEFEGLKAILDILNSVVTLIVDKMGKFRKI